MLLCVNCVLTSPRITQTDSGRRIPHSEVVLSQYLSFVQERIFLLPPMPMKAVSGRSRPMRTGFSTSTRRRRSSDEGHSSLGRGECAYHERKRFR
jgi:hypothetical protein